MNPSAFIPFYLFAALILGNSVLLHTLGCGMAGFVLVKKVPGTLMFLARAPGYSFDHGSMNMSHVAHAFMFGGWLYGAKYRTMARMHPGGIEQFWGDRMIKNQYFVSTNDHSTHEHFMQVGFSRSTMSVFPLMCTGHGLWERLRSS
jgi:hypothetical protein